MIHNCCLQPVLIHILIRFKFQGRMERHQLFMHTWQKMKIIQELDTHWYTTMWLSILVTHTIIQVEDSQLQPQEYIFFRIQQFRPAIQIFLLKLWRIKKSLAQPIRIIDITILQPPLRLLSLAWLKVMYALFEQANSILLVGVSIAEMMDVHRFLDGFSFM